MSSPTEALTQADARLLNWRFVVPGEPHGLLLLPIAGESVPGAVVPERGSGELTEVLRAGPYPAIVAPDLGAWAEVAQEGSRELLERLGASVAPGGWLYVGFGNAAYPGRRSRAGSMLPGAARRAMRAAGLRELEGYLAFPGASCPAFLVSTDGAAPLDYFLERLSFPPPPEHDHSGASGGGSPRRLALLLRAARLAPHRARVAFAPGVALVGRRPA